jgi:subtilisin family serine protease
MFCCMLVLAVSTVNVQPVFAITPAVPANNAAVTALPNAQLLGGLLGGLLKPSRLIVRDKLGLNGLNLTCLLNGCKVVGGIGDPQGQLFVIEVPSLVDPVIFLLHLLLQGGIVDAEVDQQVKTPQASVTVFPSYLNDRAPVPYYNSTVWHGYLAQTPNQLIRTDAAHSTYGVAGSGVIVADIDTGADVTHPVLKGVLVSGYDFTRNVSGGNEMADANVNQSTVAVLDGASAAKVNQSTVAVLDQSTVAVLDGPQFAAFGHGTMTAGIIHLVAPQAKIMPLKAFKSDGTAQNSDILRAIYYAVGHNAKVINMSFSYTTVSVELGVALLYATGHNVIAVASAGNDGKQALVFPAAFPNVIDVASTGNTDMPSTFSNFGAPPVLLSAPGEAVMTLYPTGSYAAAWGTSFSAPLVAGTAALLANVNPGINQVQAASAVAHGAPMPAVQYGVARLDTVLAVKAWRNTLGLK